MIDMVDWPGVAATAAAPIRFAGLAEVRSLKAIKTRLDGILERLSRH